MDNKIKRLIELHSDRAYAIALRMCGSEADAGDLVQEAFLRAIRYMESYDSSQPFEAWLYRIIRNIYTDSLRLEARRRQIPLSDSKDDDTRTLEDTLADTAPGPEKIVESHGRVDAVQAALTQLSPTLRMAVILVDLEGMGREDCARSLGCSLSALDVRLHRGRAEIQKRLQPLRENI